MGKRIVLISCVSQKQDKACKAKDLYVSALFKKCWAYANQLKPNQIYILSAKYHLLKPEKIISPYNLTLNNLSAAQRKDWARQVLKEMEATGLDLQHDKFVILAGKNYYQYLIGKNGIRQYTLPLQGKGGIGCILKFLTNQNLLQMKYNRIEVKQLRDQLAEGSCNVPKGPGVYRWWFPKEVALKLLGALNGVDNGRIMKVQIDCIEFWCLYFGISKDLRQRIRWHVAQHHSASAVESGFLSTLRKTISALLHQDESASEQAVNEVLDQCYWDWCATPTHGNAIRIETATLSTGYFPLNIQKNKSVDASVVRQLKQLRKAYKK